MAIIFEHVSIFVLSRNKPSNLVVEESSRFSTDIDFIHKKIFFLHFKTLTQKLTRKGLLEILFLFLSKKNSDFFFNYRHEQI